MVMRLSVVRYPRARALAAWTSEFMASSRELDIRLLNHPRMPFQWSSTVLAKRSRGSSPQSRAVSHQRSR